MLRQTIIPIALMIMLALAACEPQSTASTPLPIPTAAATDVIIVRPTTASTAVAAAVTTVPPADPSPVPTGDTADQNPSDVAAPVRIEFDSGASSATVSGQLQPYETRQFVFWAAAGQTARIHLDTDPERANFSLHGQIDGQPLKRVEMPETSWQGMLRFTQDFQLNVRAFAEPADFTLTLSIDPQPLSGGLAVYPIVDAETGYILGGIDPAGNWLAPADVLPTLEQPITMHAYNDFYLQGLADVSLPSQQSPICPQPTASWHSADNLDGTLLLATAWNGLPRFPQRVDAMMYEQALLTSLSEGGITNPIIGDSQATRIDLEGDGVDEVILEVHRLDAETPPVNAGDYSIVLLRKVVLGAVLEIPLKFDTYPEAVELAYPERHELMMIRDLNGDGIMEIVIRSQRYEGRSLSVFAVTPDNIELVLSANCHQ